MNRLLKLAKGAGHILAKNSPAILTGVAVVGVITTAVMVGRVTPEAKHRIEAFEDDLWEHERVRKDNAKHNDEEYIPGTVKASARDKIALTWRLYAPAVGSGVLTITAIIMANRIQSKRLAVAVGAYSLAEAALQEYQEATVREAGEETLKKIRTDIAQRKIDDTVPDIDGVATTGGGSELCYDNWSGRYFKTSIEDIHSAVNKFNHRLMNDVWLSLNELYSELGLERIYLGDDLGWTADKLVEPDIQTMLANGRIPVLVLDYYNPPKVRQRDY